MTKRGKYTALSDDRGVHVHTLEDLRYLQVLKGGNDD